jgi:translation initiation factor 1
MTVLAKNPLDFRKYTMTVPLKQTEPIRARLEKNGRGGKCVVVLSGFRLHPEGKEKILKAIKTRLGTGGALKNGELEIQGDHRLRLKPLLESLGYRL